jgi:hypothetical protein
MSRPWPAACSRSAGAYIGPGRISTARIAVVPELRRCRSDLARPLRQPSTAMLPPRRGPLCCPGLAYVCLAREKCWPPGRGGGGYSPTQMTSVDHPDLRSGAISGGGWRSEWRPEERHPLGPDMASGSRSREGGRRFPRTCCRASSGRERRTIQSGASQAFSNENPARVIRCCPSSVRPGRITRIDVRVDIGLCVSRHHPDG